MTRDAAPGPGSSSVGGVGRVTAQELADERDLGVAPTMEVDTGIDRCAHMFTRFRWARNARWRCVHCGLVTRTYDSVDAWCQRPVHEYMSIAVRGFNTTRRTNA